VSQEFTGYFTYRHWIGPTVAQRAQGKRVAIRLRARCPDAFLYGILSAVLDSLSVKPQTDDEYLADAVATLAHDPYGQRWFGWIDIDRLEKP
jgi:hypothetical protein